MLYQDVIMAGFGGQGVMLIGNLLAYAGMHHGFNVTYIPVYGPEMRGGTANCTVVIAEEEIGSPIIRSPRNLISMNRPSLDKFQGRLQDNGVQIVNSSLIDMELADSTRLRSIAVPCNDIADSIGSVRMANMVALGAFIQATQVLPLSVVQSALEHVISKRNAHLIPANAKALQAGADIVANV
ncbi:2-oxoacid:acceptor oxidoreductase family protein [Desulfobaculum bizertense]|uniref:2-oxoglutarate ferredoxin oxidoreductase subunit gamma n=1 Tax=Desulfobaculum bizertense DSM 18034 TaxID=1121442 RepID=A0A1T4X3W4_9BACT|nr:2-oxoacid:acceptor oxidoreductase family protein [Desulfobaculum bizertense]UIJ37375.1 2-oxoacid:acceptor oxidoreductase family protein [Desulfobaculum bizertense]SKA83561.1 2-oxoglutarate ferredoxin oxidoreductase subunit gamma [Desulfobaculum bizertense DSM 18034]